MADKPVDPVPEKKWQRDLRMQRQQVYRGSKYPPMTIEPVPYERQRLAGNGMSDTDRALRRQWVKDQELSPKEPRIVMELKPKNIFKRIYAQPMDALFMALRPAVGEYAAAMCRITLPRLLIIASVGYLSYYQLKYHPNDWTKVGGFHVYRNKPAVMGDQPPLPEKGPSDYAALGFKTRTVLLDGKTSAVA